MNANHDHILFQVGFQCIAIEWLPDVIIVFAYVDSAIGLLGKNVIAVLVGIVDEEKFLLVIRLADFLTFENNYNDIFIFLTLPL